MDENKGTPKTEAELGAKSYDENTEMFATAIKPDDNAIGVDPGNSPPEIWTTALTGDEVDEVAKLLEDESPTSQEG